MKKVLTLILAMLLALTPVVSSALYGDFDNDGAVRSNDLITLARHIASFEGYETINTTLADLNGDGEVSVVDGLILKRHWAGWSSYQTLPFKNTVEPEKFNDFINVRSDLSNIYNKIQNNETINIVYYGGSVTEGQGAGYTYGVPTSQTPSTANRTSWRALTFNWLQEKFPNAKFVQYNSGCGGTGSHLGAFRLEGDIIARDPDIVFIEFTANDYYGGTYADGMVTLYYESMVRRIREAHPDCEIFPVYITDNTRAKALEHTPTVLPDCAVLQEKVAEKYDLTSFNVGGALINTITQESGGLTTNWHKYIFDSVHPADEGYKVYADLIISYLDEYLCGAITNTYANDIVDYKTPAGYVDDRTETFNPQLVVLNNFSVVESYKNIAVNTSTQYQNSTIKGYMYPTSADNEIVFKFKGTGVDLLTIGLALEYSIDGGETKTYMAPADNNPKRFIDGLQDIEHTLKIKFLGKVVNGAVDTSTVTDTLLRAFLVESFK